MQTTLEIPDYLWRQAEHHAHQKGISLQEVIVVSLQHELADDLDKKSATPVGASLPANPKSTWPRRRLRPEFVRMWENGELSGGTDSSILISEDRDGR